ncbi:hypothetical protein L210DRAFT_3509915 [Boletus edulis BED1]|uniref:Uncharacterized protein n=1 Tax=Boletus edulis BED1 TaxID=1328754 RepID=A0AAD4BEI2_BOLED|nr:hypothetical protein L210DRAFT_3509915 [Boletus edulis BED1]
MYINSTKRKLKVGQDQRKENINNQIKQGFRVDRRKTTVTTTTTATTKYQETNTKQPTPPAHPIKTNRCKIRAKITKNHQKNHPHPPTQGPRSEFQGESSHDDYALKTSHFHPPTLKNELEKQLIPPARPVRFMQNQCKMRPDLIRSSPSPYQEMYINNIMTKTSHIPTLPPSKTPRSSNQSHPPAQGFLYKICAKSVQNDTRSYQILAFPLPINDINSTKRKLKVGQDQRKENNINSQIKLGFRVSTSEKP